MNVGDLQDFLRKLGALLEANQGSRPASEIEAFCAGLEPHRERSVREFAELLRDAATGAASPLGERPSPARRRTAKAASAPKAALKKKTDLAAIDEAAVRLQGLYDRATDADLTHEAIETEVDRIDREFDTEGLKAVARKFGVSSSMASKAAAKTRILHRISERKGRHERGEVIGEVARAAAASPIVPPEPSVVVEPAHGAIE